MATSNTQCRRILRYMEDFGSITQMDAMNEFGCMRLASRISDLRRMGHAIRKETVSGKNRYGESIRFAKYSLIEEDTSC